MFLNKSSHPSSLFLILLHNKHKQLHKASMAVWQGYEWSVYVLWCLMRTLKLKWLILSFLSTFMCKEGIHVHYEGTGNGSGLVGNKKVGCALNTGKDKTFLPFHICDWRGQKWEHALLGQWGDLQALAGMVPVLFSCIMFYLNLYVNLYPYKLNIWHGFGSHVTSSHLVCNNERPF